MAQLSDNHLFRQSDETIAPQNDTDQALSPDNAKFASTHTLAATTFSEISYPQVESSQQLIDSEKMEIVKKDAHTNGQDSLPSVCPRCKDDIESPANMTTRVAKDSKLVTWNGPDDPERPKNMSQARKTMVVVTTGLMTFCVAFGSSVFSSATFVTAEQFHVSEEVMMLGLSLYVLGFAVGPMVWGPLSEVYGRTRPLWVGMVVFCIFQIPVAVGQNLQTILVFRFLGGMFGSAPLAIVGGMFVDFLDSIQMGIANAIFAGAVLLGPAVGPIVGSFIVHSHLGWRWTAWITLIMTAFFTIVCWVVTPETFEQTLLERKAKKLRYETQDWALHAQSEEQRFDLTVLANKYLTKPIIMIVKEPVLIILTLYTTLAYVLLYLTFEAFPISFQFERGWSPTVASLPFLAILVGVVFAAVVVAWFTLTWYSKKLASRGRSVPEDRIPLMALGAVLLPVGLFWFAWTSSPTTSWVPQAIAGAFFGAGIVLIFMACIGYMVDVYLLNANSAIAINTFIRSVVGASGPLWAKYLFVGLGMNWATSLLGFVAVAMMPFPVIFWFYGARIRGLSKFAFTY